MMFLKENVLIIKETLFAGILTIYDKKEKKKKPTEFPFGQLKRYRFLEMPLRESYGTYHLFTSIYNKICTMFYTFDLHFE